MPELTTAQWVLVILLVTIQIGLLLVGLVTLFRTPAERLTARDRLGPGLSGAVRRPDRLPGAGTQNQNRPPSSSVPPKPARSSTG